MAAWRITGRQVALPHLTSPPSDVLLIPFQNAYYATLPATVSCLVWQTLLTLATNFSLPIATGDRNQWHVVQAVEEAAGSLGAVEGINGLWWPVTVTELIEAAHCS